MRGPMAHVSALESTPEPTPNLPQEITAGPASAPYNHLRMQLSSDVRIENGMLAAIALRNEKPRQGVPSKNPALHLGIDACNSTLMLGLQSTAALNRIGSRSTGKERDAESGLDYFGARYYASSMGRWMSPDWSAKAEPVPYSKLGDPQTLNLYGYLTNNPLSRTDPDGHGHLLDKFIAIFYGKASAGPGVGTELKATKYAKVEIGAKAQIEARGTSSGVDVTAKGVVEAKATVGKTTAGVSGEVDKQLVKDGKFDPQPATTTGNIGINPATAGPNEIGVEGHIGAVGLEGGIDVDKVKEFGSAVGDSINSLGQYILNAVTPNPNASPSPPGVSGSNPFNIPLPTPPKQ